MKTTIGLWIDHRKAAIVTVSDKGEKTKVIESMVEKQPGRIAGARIEAVETEDNMTDGQIVAKVRNYFQN